MPISVTDLLRSSPPFVHGAGDAYFGLAWDALAWLEGSVDAGMATLETGTGASTIVFASKGSQHTAISPAAGEHERIAAYCRAQSIDPTRVSFIAEPSHLALPRLGSSPLDVALIDGAHGFPYPILDWALVAPRLRIGGHLLVDDAHLEPVAPLIRHLAGSRSWSLEGVFGGRTVHAVKLDDQEPSFGIEDPRSRVSFGYLQPASRLAQSMRYRLLDSGPARPLVRRAIARRAARVQPRSDARPD